MTTHGFFMRMGFTFFVAALLPNGVCVLELSNTRRYRKIVAKDIAVGKALLLKWALEL
jgi:hypothetical protein